jgi:DNA-damage-inducible protein J
MLHVRVEHEIKEKATVALSAMGLSVSEAVRLFLHRVVADQAIPWELKVPNARTRAEMAQA